MIQQDIKAASAANASCLFIGQDRGGHWVVKDAHSLCGGLFANRNEAIRFAMYECQRRPQSVIMLPDGPALDGPLDEQEGSNPTKRPNGITRTRRAARLRLKNHRNWP